MSAITYNGVNLGYVLTERLSLVPEMDPSGTDQLYTKFSLTIRSIFHAGLAPSVSTNETPSEIANRVRHLLLTPRRAFSYANGGTTAISVADVDGDGFVRDDAAGPNPIECTFTELYPGAWVVSYTVDCRLVDCGTGSANRGYLSLKWSDSISYSDTFAATRRRTGQIVFSQRTPRDPDDFRPLVTPSVPAGFRRQSAEYTLNYAGTEVRFSFADQQLHTVPPYPAVKMSGRQVETAAIQGGPRYGQLSLRLEGTPGTNKRSLFELAVYIAMTRVFAAGKPAGGVNGTSLIGSVIGESLTDTETAVDISLNWQMEPASGRVTGSRTGLASTGQPSLLSFVSPLASQVFQSWLGSSPPAPPPPQAPNQQGLNKAGMNNTAAWLGSPIPGSDPALGIAPPTSGVANQVKLIAAALNDPCASGTQLNPIKDSNTLVGTTPDGSTTTVNVVPSLPDDQSGLYSSADGRDGVYESYTLTSHYTHISGRAVLPSTKKGEPSAVVRLHNDRLLLQVDWSAARRGAPPVLPNPNPYDDEGVVLLKATVSPQEIQVGADGVTPYYQVTGIYYYEFLDPCNVSIVAPIPPYLEGSIGQQARIVAGVASDAILFGAARSGGQVSIFCGVGMEYLNVAELSTFGGPQFLPPVGP